MKQLIGALPFWVVWLILFGLKLLAITPDALYHFSGGVDTSPLTVQHLFLGAVQATAVVFALVVLVWNREISPTMKIIIVVIEGAFAIAFALDFGVHQLFGVETGVDQPLSPPHMILEAGVIALLLLKFLEEWFDSERRELSFLGLLSIASATGFAMVAMNALNLFMRRPFFASPVVENWESMATIQIQNTLALTLMPTILVTIAILIILGRFTVFRGAFILFFLLLIPFNMMNGNPAVPFIFALTGIAAEVAAAMPSRANSLVVVSTSIFVMWMSYLGLFFVYSPFREWTGVSGFAWTPYLSLTFSCLPTIVAALLVMLATASKRGRQEE